MYLREGTHNKYLFRALGLGLKFSFKLYRLICQQSDFAKNSFNQKNLYRNLSTCMFLILQVVYLQKSDNIWIARVAILLLFVVSQSLFGQPHFLSDDEANLSNDALSLHLSLNLKKKKLLRK